MNLASARHVRGVKPCHANNGGSLLLGQLSNEWMGQCMVSGIDFLPIDMIQYKACQAVSYRYLSLSLSLSLSYYMYYSIKGAPWF
jgi:hypothetical protein